MKELLIILLQRRMNKITTKTRTETITRVSGRGRETTVKQVNTMQYDAYLNIIKVLKDE